ncbi:hypothetical protein [Chamaesiphon sp. VAR_48_metabat_135_sub]|uniref:hypothetical protein n=1 Tax=Chamaesiphon sp. VAR_48_metabat_135_sub TaxID=2964699 RepID=UPI00286B76D8|nr:hypothetical protein [Chamaesiphon sp. VAR_48_metabat_135_sub]
MSSNPLVSVIIIFSNAGKTFFEEAIDSVFAQTDRNWELLLVCHTVILKFTTY